jgi:hypothetical protein
VPFIVRVFTLSLPVAGFKAAVLLSQVCPSTYSPYLHVKPPSTPTSGSMESLDNQSARDFSDAQLKPAPLRLQKSQSSIGVGPNDVPDSQFKHVRINEAVTEINDHPNTTRAPSPAGLCGPPPCAQTITPAFAALMSKFEKLYVVSTSRSELFGRLLTLPLSSHRHGIFLRRPPMLTSPQPPTLVSGAPASSPPPNLKPAASTLWAFRRQHCL